MSWIPGRRWEPASVYLFMNASVSFLFGLAFTTNLVYQVSTAQLTPLQLVLVGSVVEATILLFEVPTGLVADGTSRRLSVLVGLGLTGGSFLIQGAFPVFAWILLSQVVWGIGYTFTSGATTAWLVDEIGEAAAGRLFLRETRLSNLVGIAAIPLGVVIGSINLAAPLLISGALFLLLTGVLALRMPETALRPATSGPGRGIWRGMLDTLTRSLRFAGRHPDLRLLFSISAVAGAASEGFDRLMTVHWIRDVGFPTAGGLEPVAWLAAINLTAMLLSAIGARWLERRVDTTDRRQLARALSLLVGVTILGGVAFGLARGFGVALVGSLGVRVSRTLGSPLSQSWLNRSLPSDLRATVLSLEGQMDAMGQVAGGPIIGWIGSAISVPAALVTSAAALLPAAALYRRWRPGAEPSLPVEA